MGLSSFPTTVSDGVLPILIVNTALSFAIIKDVLRSLLQIVGFNMPASTESEFMDPSWQEASPSSVVHAQQVNYVAEEIRQTLPIKKFSLEDDEHRHVECAVCLSRFEHDDETRELPCCHLFHRHCLDKWLDHHHTTCPLCRSSLVSQEAANNIRMREQEPVDEWMFWCSSSYQEGIVVSR